MLTLLQLTVLVNTSSVIGGRGGGSEGTPSAEVWDPKNHLEYQKRLHFINVFIKFTISGKNWVELIPNSALELCLHTFTIFFLWCQIGKIFISNFSNFHNSFFKNSSTGTKKILKKTKSWILVTPAIKLWKCQTVLSCSGPKGPPSVGIGLKLLIFFKYRK